MSANTEFIFRIPGVYLKGTIKKTICDIDIIHVDESKRRQGAGRKAVELFLDVARRCGAKRFRSLNGCGAMPGSVRFWESLGFEVGPENSGGFFPLKKKL